MSAPQVIQLLVAIGLVVLGIWLYRRRSGADSRRGSQGAVILFVIAALVGIHALGLMDYRPSPAEIEAGRP